MSPSAPHYRICPLCEATCGLEIHTEGRRARAIRGDAADVFSGGFICPKGAALAELDADPDRLRTPLVRHDGRLVPAAWDDAFAEVAGRLLPVIDPGRDAVQCFPPVRFGRRDCALLDTLRTNPLD